MKFLIIEFLTAINDYKHLSTIFFIQFIRKFILLASKTPITPIYQVESKHSNLANLAHVV